MKANEIMDFIQKKINSILFRLVLIVFSILLLCTHPNVFDGYVYVPITIVYFLLFIFFTKNSNARLFNDFLFMNLILLGKDPNEIMVFIFIILPVINSINFSGDKRSPILYLLTGVMFIVQLCFFKKNIKVEFIVSNSHPLMSLLFLWTINWYTDLRNRIKQFRDDLISVVDDFYLKKEEIKRPHKIYKKLIDVIHSNTRKIHIKGIICFTIYKDEFEKLVLINGSSFTWGFKIDNTKIIDDLRERKRLLNISLMVDGKEKPFNLALYSKVQEQEYIYVFITKKRFPVYYLLIGLFDRTLTPAFKKISNVLLSEKKLQEIRNEEVAILSAKSQYVSRANKTMHHIRNRLGPFSNLIKMLESLNSIPSDKLNDFKAIIEKETEMARTELNSIISRANKMLEKDNNPFVYTKLDQISVQRVYSILKRNFHSFFPNTDIDIDITIDTEVNKKMVYINEEGFELFLSDWLNNMSKYNKNFAGCKFILTDLALEIHFCNDYISTKSEIEKLILDLTSNDRNEIMRRTTHGLYTIKVTLEDMNIPFLPVHDYNENKLILKLIIKTHNYENSSI